MNRLEFEELELQVQQSSLPLKSYLQQIGVRYSTYHYWHRKCFVDRTSVKQGLAPISFKQSVESSPEEQVPHGVAVLFPNGPRAHFGNGSENCSPKVFEAAMFNQNDTMRYFLCLGRTGFSMQEMEEPSNMCDTRVLIKLVQQFKTFDEFMAACKMHSQSEVLDMFDIYYNFQWACDDKRINPSTNCGELNGEVVMERRKALEWLISEEQDWNEISLDT